MVYSKKALLQEGQDVGGYVKVLERVVGFLMS